VRHLFSGIALRSEIEGVEFVNVPFGSPEALTFSSVRWDVSPGWTPKALPTLPIQRTLHNWTNGKEVLISEFVLIVETSPGKSGQ
jgi:hypothetical protein